MATAPHRNPTPIRPSRHDIYIKQEGQGPGPGTGDGGGDGWGRKQGVKDSPREKHSNKCRIPTDDNEPGQTA